jgi:tetratricopeptide (TPR) repeat protein
MQRRILGQTHPNVAASLAVLGRWQNEAGNQEQAEAMLREALSLQLDLLEADHPDTAITRLDLAEVLLVSGNYTEALDQARLSEAALTKTLSDEHWITAVARQVHGAALHASGDFPAAEELIQSSYQQLADDPGAKPAYVDKALERLIALYRDWGKTDMAKTYQDIQARMR